VRDALARAAVSTVMRRGPLRGSVGLGEGYVDGLWETDDLVALIRIAARERRIGDVQALFAKPG
jgi:hypothetical protein